MTRAARVALPAALVAAALVGLAGPSAGAPGGGVVRVEHRDPQTAPTRGPTTAPVVVELFFSPNTNATARLPIIRALERLQANHPTRIRLVYRVIKRAGGQQIAIAALEAHAQGKFEELLAELHADRTTAMLTKDKVLEIAKRAGMDVSRLTTAILEGRYSEVFDGNEQRLGRLTHTDNPGVPNVLFNARTIRASLGAPNDNDLEREYVAAYERALELVDRGVPQKQLMAAFEEQALRREQPFVMSMGSDDEFDEPETDHKLAKPPLDVRGLPTFGKPDVVAPIPVLVLCRPNDASCHGMLRVARNIQKIYADEVRIVWAPWFDVARDDAAELAMLGDATLCAEQVGSSPGDLDESPGWAWITTQLETVNRRHGRKIPAEQLIDTVTAELQLDSRALSACRARMANTTLEWIARARRSGVTRSPAVVIGGRIYEGLNDSTVIQQLIEAELAPGILARCSTIGCAD